MLSIELIPSSVGRPGVPDDHKSSESAMRIFRPVPGVRSCDLEGDKSEKPVCEQHHVGYVHFYTLTM